LLPPLPPLAILLQNCRLLGLEAGFLGRQHHLHIGAIAIEVLNFAREDPVIVCEGGAPGEERRQKRQRERPEQQRMSA
jgi:hypothetical protein